MRNTVQGAKDRNRKIIYIGQTLWPVRTKKKKNTPPPKTPKTKKKKNYGCQKKDGEKDNVKQTEKK